MFSCFQMFVDVVRQNVNNMEDCVSKAENEMGSFSGFKKMFSSFVGQVSLKVETLFSSLLLHFFLGSTDSR